ncbi:hypothetical protein Ancab_039476 [Ancistrocladus abbreviatus]
MVKLCQLFLYSVVSRWRLLAKFDVEAASAAAPITDTVLGRNSSDTLLEDGSGVISGEITGGKASEKPDEVIYKSGTPPQQKSVERKRGLEMIVMVH